MNTENLTFTLKSHQMLSVTCTLEKFERATFAGQFGFVGKLAEENHIIIVT